MTADREEQAVAAVAEQLGRQFADLPRATVLEVVADVHRDFVGRPVRDFVPILVGRVARDRLRRRREAA